MKIKFDHEAGTIHGAIPGGDINKGYEKFFDIMFKGPKVSQTLESMLEKIEQGDEDIALILMRAINREIIAIEEVI